MGWWPLGSETSLAELQGGVQPPSQTCTVVFVFSIGQIHAKKKKKYGAFPGGPVVKTPRFQCRGHRFDIWSGNWIPHAVWCAKKAKKSVFRPVWL